MVPFVRHLDIRLSLNNYINRKKARLRLHISILSTNHVRLLSAALNGCSLTFLRKIVHTVDNSAYLQATLLLGFDKICSINSNSLPVFLFRSFLSSCFFLLCMHVSATSLLLVYNLRIFLVQKKHFSKLLFSNNRVLLFVV